MHLQLLSPLLITGILATKIPEKETLDAYRGHIWSDLCNWWNPIFHGHERWNQLCQWFNVDAFRYRIDLHLLHRPIIHLGTQAKKSC